LNCFCFWASNSPLKVKRGEREHAILVEVARERAEEPFQKRRESTVSSIGEDSNRRDGIGSNVSGLDIIVNDTPRNRSLGETVQ